MQNRNSLLADMAREASLERSDFLVRAGEQLQRFMAAHAGAADLYAGAADTRAAGQPAVPKASSEAEAADALYDLALEFQERSQRAESNLIESFENAASGLLGQVGTLVIVDDEDEHLALGVGGFRARVIPEGESGWRDLAG